MWSWLRSDIEGNSKVAVTDANESPSATPGFCCGSDLDEGIMSTKEDAPVVLHERRSKQKSSTAGGVVSQQDVVVLLESRVANVLPISSLRICSFPACVGK